MTRAHSLLALALLTACSTRTDSLPRQDGGANADMTSADLGTTLDADAHDAGRDANLYGDAGSDASTTDSAVRDASAPDASMGCEYIPWNPFIVSCTTGYEQGVSYFNTAGSSEACPEYFMFMSHSAATAEEVVASVEGCDASCVYMAAGSADGVYCGLRFSVDDYHAPAGDEVCPPLYAFGGGPPDSEGNRGGIYTSAEEYQADHPCPDIGDAHEPVPPID